MQRNKSRLHRKPNRRFNPRPKPAPFLLHFSCSAFFPRFSLKFSIAQPTCFFASFSESSVGHVFANCFLLACLYFFDLLFFLGLPFLIVVFFYLFADMMLLFHFFGIGLSLDT
jgi:hypothetical protein